MAFDFPHPHGMGRSVARVEDIPRACNDAGMRYLVALAALSLALGAAGASVHTPTAHAVVCDFAPVDGESPQSAPSKKDGGGGHTQMCGGGIFACNNGQDDDGDGLRDYGGDPGCASTSDNDEYNYVPPPPPPEEPPPPPPPPPPGYAQCSDGQDNDGDGKWDYPADPGCTDNSDNDEYNAPPPSVYACSDGADNDADAKVDMADPGCTGPTDNDEWNLAPVAAACGDGTDNDGDGKIDLADPGCVNTADTDEYNAPPPPPPAACADNLDNDGDGKADMLDPGCSWTGDNDEYNYVAPPPPAETFQWVDWSAIGCTSDTVYCYSSPADRCAVKPSAPSMSVTMKLTGVFENQCRFIPLKLNNVACLIRYPDIDNPAAYTGSMVQCWSNMKWTSPYVKLQFNYTCQYTTIFYKWKLQGYGYVTTVGGKSFTSPTVSSPFWRGICF